MLFLNSGAPSSPEGLQSFKVVTHLQFFKAIEWTINISAANITQISKNNNFLLLFLHSPTDRISEVRILQLHCAVSDVVGKKVQWPSAQLYPWNIE